MTTRRAWRRWKRGTMYGDDIPGESVWSATASALLGRPCRVRLVRECIVAGAGGAAYHDPDGVAAVEVKRKFDTGRMLFVFAHEVAHHHHQHETKRYMGWPGRFVVPVEQLQEADKENQADELAERWLEFAVKNATRPDLAGQLEALRGWRYRDLIKQAVDSALKRREDNGHGISGID